MTGKLQTDLTKVNYSRIARCGDCNAVIKILPLQKANALSVRAAIMCCTQPTAGALNAVPLLPFQF